MFARLSRFCFRHRFATIVVWLAVLVAGVMASGPVFSALSDEQEVRFESAEASKVLKAASEDRGTVVAIVDQVDPKAAGTKSAIEAATAELRGKDGIRQVDDPYSAGRAGAGLIAKDQRALMVIAHVTKGVEGDRKNTLVKDVTTRLRAVSTAVPGSSVQVGGGLVLNKEINDVVAGDTTRAELISLPLTLLFMVLVFGGFAAASLPVLGALVSIGAAMVGLWGFSTFASLDTNTVTVTTMLGLGLSIDYGLLLLSRYREELARGLSKEDAAAAAGGTAGRTIAFSALIVAAAMGGLLVVDVPFLQAIGAAGVSIALVTMLVSVSLVPALIRVFGRWIKPAKKRAGHKAGSGLLAALASGVQRRPALVLGVTLLALLAAAIPLLGAKLSDPGLKGIPTSIESRRVVDTLADRFGRTEDPAAVVVARTDPATLNTWAARHATDPRIAKITPAEPAGTGLSRVNIMVHGERQGTAARDLVGDLRADRPQGGQSWVTGEAASFKDRLDLLASDLPWSIGIMVLAMAVLLFLMTGSVLIPLKALLMNLVSMGATFGIMVAVFQNGFLAEPLGMLVNDGLDPFNLLVVFAFAFGLSMDYEVFLLSRIKEQHDAGQPNNLAVRNGLLSSGRIITAAAACMVIVFSFFAMGHISGIQQIGLGLVLAVVIDATIVRCLLVPATMTLLGRLNWWAPKPLRALHRRFGLHEHSAATAAVPEPARKDLTPVG